MARAIKVGVEFSGEAKTAEAAAKRTQDSIKKTAEVAKSAMAGADDTAKKLAGRINERFGAVGLTMGAIGVGVASMRSVFAGIEQQIASMAPQITGLTESVSGFSAAARAMAETANDPIFDRVGGSLARWLVVIDEALTQSDAKREIAFQKQQGADENRRRNEAAYLAQLDAEVAQKNQSVGLAEKNVALLAKMRAAQEAANKENAAKFGARESGRLGDQPQSAAMELALMEYRAEQSVQMQREQMAESWHARKIAEINRRYSFESNLISQQTATLEEQAQQKQAWSEQEMESAVSLSHQFGIMAGQHAGMMMATGKTDKYMRDMTRSAAKMAMQMALTAVSAAIMRDAIATGGFGAMASAIATVGALSFAFGAATELITRSGVMKAEQGGLVRGGVQNRDSVPMMLMPGERVLSKEQTRAYDMGAGSQSIVVNMSPVWQTAAPPSEAEVKRFVMRNLKGALEELAADGYLKLARA